MDLRDLIRFVSNKEIKRESEKKEIYIRYNERLFDHDSFPPLFFCRGNKKKIDRLRMKKRGNNNNKQGERKKKRRRLPPTSIYLTAIRQWERGAKRKKIYIYEREKIIIITSPQNKREAESIFLS